MAIDEKLDEEVRKYVAVEALSLLLELKDKYTPIEAISILSATIVAFAALFESGEISDAPVHTLACDSVQILVKQRSATIQ